MNQPLAATVMEDRAALVMVPIIAKEGFTALKGETCSDCSCN